jgi:hypothetical protein
MKNDRAAQRNSGARGKFLIRDPYYFSNNVGDREEWRGGQVKNVLGHIQKNVQKNFSGQATPKLTFKKKVPDKYL